MALIVIPARYGSSRLPGKPLLSETGRPLIVHVLESAARARSADRVVVATDDRRILDAVLAAGGEAVLTSDRHRSGTDRVAEAAAGLPGEIVINVQGDEPEVDPEHIDRLDAALGEDPEADVATLAAPLAPEDAENPNVVKVVVDRRYHALYFSRAPIPFARREVEEPRLRHAGVYAFRREALERFVKTEPTPLETTESLEQLRALETGMSIRVVVVDRVAPGVDTAEDYEAFVARRRKQETSTFDE